MSYSPVCTSFLQQPTLAIYTCFLHSTSSSTVLREIKKKKIVAMLLPVAVNKSSVQNMKFTKKI